MKKTHKPYKRAIRTLLICFVFNIAILREIKQISSQHQSGGANSKKNPLLGNLYDFPRSNGCVASLQQGIYSRVITKELIEVITRLCPQYHS